VKEKLISPVNVQVQSRSQIPNASGVNRVDFRTCISVVNVFSTVQMESIFSTVDDRIERGTNQLDFHKIELMHSTSDDRVERGTNQLDFHKIELMHVHSTSDDRVKCGTNRIEFVDH